jgi:hypothetical protein
MSKTQNWGCANGRSTPAQVEVVKMPCLETEKDKKIEEEEDNEEDHLHVSWQTFEFCLKSRCKETQSLASKTFELRIAFLKWQRLASVAFTATSKSVLTLFTRRPFS